MLLTCSSISNLHFMGKWIAYFTIRFIRDNPSFNRTAVNSAKFDEEYQNTMLSKGSIEQLYIIIVNLIENVGKLTSITNVCEHILRTLHLVILFLDDDQINGLPILLATAVSFFPPAVHSNVIELLCSVVIPLVYVNNSQDSYALDSIPSMLTTVLQHVESPECHSWLLESLLSRKKDLYKDLFTVIAYGSTEARLPAVYLLFHYWPELCPSAFQIFDSLKPKHYAWEPWKPVTCERTDCPNKPGKAFAMKMTMDPQVAVKYGNKPPPLYVCLDCADALNRRDVDQLTDILLPSRQISMVCESKTCRSKNNTAILTCYSVECAFLNGNRPIRFCETCHLIRHSSQAAEVNAQGKEPATVEHVYQTQIPDIWVSGLDLQPMMLEAIVTLIRETQPRWRQLLLGLPEEPGGSGTRAGGGLERTISGGCASGSGIGIGGGPAGPGGPPQLPPAGSVPSASEFLMPAASGAGSLGSAAVSSNPSPSIPAVNFDGTSVMREGGAQARPTFQVSGRFAVGPNGEPELTLEGRYDDEDHKILAVYGAMLAGEKCRPSDRVNLDILTRITAGVFNWFLDTAYTNEVATNYYQGYASPKTHHELGELIERLKSEYMLKWIQEVQHTHPEVILAVLLPHPVEVARVGSCWDTLCGKTAIVKQGLSRISSLIPYDVMTFETWDYIIPYWLESIRTEVKPDDYRELEILLKKVFDATAGPFPFLPAKVYHFAGERFIDATAPVQDQVLSWLEILTAVEVAIPMKELFTMFRSGVSAFLKAGVLGDTTCLEERHTLERQSLWFDDDYDPENFEASDDAVSFASDEAYNTGGVDSDDASANLLDEMDEEDEENDDEEEEDAFEEEAYDRSVPQEVGDDAEDFEAVATSAVDADDSSGLLVPGPKSSLEKRGHKKSYSSAAAPLDAPRFFLGEKRGLKSSVSRKVSEEPSVLVEGVKRSIMTKDRFVPAPTTPAAPRGALAANVKRQSRRSSVLNRGQKMRVSPWTNKETVVYRSTRCLGQMLSLVLKQLKLSDPFGHGGFTQETPQLVLSLLSDMLNLTWMPAGLRNGVYKDGGNENIRSRTQLRRMTSMTTASRCMGHCTAPSPVSSQQSAPTVGVVGPAGSGASGNLAALLSATQAAVAAVGDDDFCAYCQDVCWWFELASLLCHHLAPASPPALPRLELSTSAVGAFLTRPDYPKWCTGLAASEIMRRTDGSRSGPVEDERSPAQEALGLDSMEPSEADLLGFPPALRFIYQLLRCLMGKSGCAGVSYFIRTQSSTGTEAESRAKSEEQPRIAFEGRTPRDPVVLRHLLECLNCLIRVGNVLQNILNAAARAAEMAAAAAAAMTVGTVTSIPATRAARTGGGTAGGAASSATANSNASLSVQASFVLYLVEHCLIPTLWNLLTAEHSHLASWVVPLLLQSLTVPNMAGVFWRLVEHECTHPDWKVRFDAMEKIHSLLRQLDFAVVSGFYNGPAFKDLSVGRQATSSTVSSSAGGGGGGLAARAGRRVGAFRAHNSNAAATLSASGSYGSNLLWGGSDARGVLGKAMGGAMGPLHPFVLNSIAHLFSRLIGSLDDYSSVVAQRSSYHLNELDDNALSCCIQCMEYHFDTIAADRTIILKRMQQLSFALPNRQIFTWNFFIDRFGILSIGAQIAGKTNPDIDSVTDLNNMNKRGDAFQQQFNRAVFAASGAGMLPSVVSQPNDLGVGSKRNKTWSAKPQRRITAFKRSDEHDSGRASPSAEAQSQASCENRRLRPSVIKLTGFFSGGPGSTELMDSANKFLCSLQLKLDQDGSDRGALHQWVRLLLRFMATVDMESGGQGSKSRRGAPTDELRDKKALSKVQRHLALLLGYADQAFNIPPYKLRTSTVFHAFISHVADVLDRNPPMGSCILHQTLMVLQVCASPQRYANDCQAPNFTLRLLEPQVRHHWLNTLIIILYKYEYNSPSGAMNPSSSFSGVGGYKTSVDALNCGPSGVDFMDSQFNAGDTICSMGGARPSGFSPGHGTSFCTGTGMSTAASGAAAAAATGANTSSSCFINTSSTFQWGTRGIIEYLIRIVLNTLETQVHICKERNEDDVFDSPSMYLPRLRDTLTKEASNISTEVKSREVEAPIHEDDDEVIVMPGITISQDAPSEHTSQVSTDKDVLDFTDLSPAIPPGTGLLAEKRGFPHYTKFGKDRDLEPASGLRFASPIMKKVNRCHQDSRDELQQSSVHKDSTEMKESLEVPFSLTLASTGYKPFKPGAVSLEERAILPPTVSDAGFDKKGQGETHEMSGKLEALDTKSGDFGEPLTTRNRAAKTHALTEPQADASISSPILQRDAIKLTVSQTRERPPLNRALEVDDENGSSELRAQTAFSFEDSVGLHRTPRVGGIGSSRRVASLRTRSTYGGGGGGEMTSTMASVLATAMLSTERCPWCQMVLETHDETTIGLGLICLATFVHREPGLAAPFLIDMLMVAARIATTTLYTWQRALPNVIVSGNVASIARQFLRCTIYNLAPNGLFTQLFQTPIPDPILFRAVISVLVNFEDHMSLFYPLISALDSFNKRKSLPIETLNTILENVATYLENLPRLTDEQKWNNFISSGWAELMPLFETFFRKLSQIRPLPTNLASTLRSMICILRAPTNSTIKQGVTDAYAAILRLVIEQCHVDSPLLIEICSLCNRTFKERAKSQLTKIAVESLMNALKFRIYLPDENLLKMLQLVLMDAGGTLEPNQISPSLTDIFNPQTFHLFSTGAAELMRPHIADCLNILSDVHMIRKVKQAQKTAAQPLPNPNDGNSGAGTCSQWTSSMGLSSSGVQNSGFANSSSCAPAAAANVPSLHEDTIGAHLKSGLAQYVALELSRHSNVKDEDVLIMLSPGLLAEDSNPGILDPPVRRGGVTSGTSGKPGTSAAQQQQYQQPQPSASKLSGSLSAGGSFRSVGQSSGGSSFSGGRQFGRNSTSLTFGGGDGAGSDGGSVYSGPKVSTSNCAAGSALSGGGGGGGHISLAVPNLTSRSPSIASVLAAPGGIGQQSIMSIGHFALVPTLSHTTRLDAPILQYLPWLKSIPTFMQQGPRDFLLCLERVRTLTWLLLGATMHTALTRDATGLTCRPLPFTFVNSVADLVKFLISGFPDQQKLRSVAVMSSLYHAFLLCQVWTVYCESAGSLHPINSNAHRAANGTALEFWLKIAPTITHLLSVSEDATAINGHLLTVLEELKECRSIIVDKLITIWLPGNVLKRLQKCIEWEPPGLDSRLHVLLRSASVLMDSGRSGAGGSGSGGISSGGGGGVGGGVGLDGSESSPCLSSARGVDVNLCSANSINGCTHTEGACAGHSLGPAGGCGGAGGGSGVGTALSEGCGCTAVGSSGFLSNRLVRWLKKQIFVLGRNEDQHSTATHIFIH
uniref:Protein unc 79 n=1 Tax=Echinococcus granulosus TaxID=6210 RepID=A0A068WG06_ECHGR|nr:protein unc 79 [Echinococcus granulosus]